MAAKLVENRYIVLFPCHVIREHEPKNKEPEAKTTQNKNINTNKNNPHKTQETTRVEALLDLELRHWALAAFIR